MARKILSALCVVLLAGCTATPDLSGWAESSAVLSKSIKQHNANTLDVFDTVVLKAEVGAKESWTGIGGIDAAQLKADKQAYADNSVTVDVGLTAMVRYADAVAALAAAGETGREAAESLLSSVDSIANTLKAANPLSAGAWAGVQTVLGAISDVATRVQAQESLAETLEKMQPNVDALANSVKMYADNQLTIVSSLQSLRESLLRAEYGPRRIGKSKGAYRDAEALVAGGLPTDAEGTAQLEMLQAQSAYYREYEKKKSNGRKWREVQQNAVIEIGNAAALWATAHREATDILVKCGGLRSLRSGCGTYSAVKLKDAAAKIDVLIDALDKISDG